MAYPIKLLGDGAVAILAYSAPYNRSPLQPIDQAVPLTQRSHEHVVNTEACEKWKPPVSARRLARDQIQERHRPTIAKRANELGGRCVAPIHQDPRPIICWSVSPPPGPKGATCQGGRISSRYTAGMTSSSRGSTATSLGNFRNLGGIIP